MSILSRPMTARQTRGYTLYAAGAVTIDAAAARRIDATVIGSTGHAYSVTLDDRAGARCTCHDFQNRAATCKHIYAAMIAREERAAADAAAARRHVRPVGFRVPAPEPAPRRDRAPESADSLNADLFG